MPTTVTPALERDSGPLDPLLIALGVDVRDGESWTLLECVPPLSIWALRVPGLSFRGFVICRDSKDGERRCRRIDATGLELEVIVGRKHVTPVYDASALGYGDHRIDEAAAAVDRVCGGSR